MNSTSQKKKDEVLRLAGRDWKEDYTAKEETYRKNKHEEFEVGDIQHTI